MADGEKRVIDLQALSTNDLTANHYFLVDDASNDGDTYRYSASDYKVNMQITAAVLYNEVDINDVAWDSNTQYHKHDIVIYTDYMLYMCKVDDSTRGTWVSNEWQQITLLELWGDSMMTISTEPMLFDGTPYSKNDIVYRISPNSTAPYKMSFYKAKADLPNGISSYVATDWNEFSTITDLIEDCNRQIDKLEDDMSQALAEGTVSGSIATFTDGSTLPMRKLEVAIEPVQSGSGEPSPTNVRPISGWDECNVTRCGKNLIPSITEGVELDSQTGTTKPNVSWYVTDYARVEYSKTYYLSGTSSSTVCYYDKTKTFTRRTLSSRTITPQEGEYYVRFNSLISGYSEPQLEEGTEATSFSPFGTTYTIDLDGTYYGGKLDIVSGVLTVDRMYKDLGDLNWTLESGIFRLNESIGAKLTTNTSAVANMLCSIYKTVSQNAMGSTSTDHCIAGLNWSNGVRVKDSDYTDTTSFKTAMNGVQLVYELATPQTIQLTPTEVKSLLATNNVFADTGDILDATYVRNANITINDLIRRIEALES